MKKKRKHQRQVPRSDQPTCLRGKVPFFFPFFSFVSMNARTGTHSLTPLCFYLGRRVFLLLMVCSLPHFMHRGVMFLCCMFLFLTPAPPFFIFFFRSHLCGSRPGWKGEDRTGSCAPSCVSAFVRFRRRLFSFPAPSSTAIRCHRRRF